DVIECVRRREGVELSGLVLNERGWEHFAAAGLDRVNVTFAATETFNVGNGDDLVLVRLSVRRTRRPRGRGRARVSLRRPGGGRPGRHDRSRDAVRSP